MIEIDSETPIFGPIKTKKSQVDTKKIVTFIGSLA